jgi:hypothetical protein
MAGTGDDAGQVSGPPDGRRRREPQTIDVTPVEMPVEAAGSATPGSAEPASAPGSASPPAARARSPWFAVLAAGTLGAGLAVLAGGAAWIYFAPLEDRGADELRARLARLELQTRSAAEAAATTVPDNASAAKIDELSARLVRLETASAAAAPENGRTDIGRIDDLSARLSRLETAAAATPPDSGTTDTAAINGEFTGEISGKISGLSERLAKLEASIAAMPAPVAPDPTLAGRLAALEAAVKPIAEHVAELDRQFGDNAAAAQEARERAESVAKAMAEVSRADADQDKLHQSTKEELTGLDRRLDAFEGLVKALKDQVAEFAAPKTDDPLRFALVAAGLHSALERGEPFAAELAAAKAVGVDPALLDGFAPFADTGVPKPDELFRELTGLIPEMLKVSAPAANGNYLDRLQAHAEKLVRIRPVGDRPGDDAATMIGRIDRDMARRDLAGVLGEIERLPAPAQAIAEPWRKKAVARQAAIAASAQLVTASFTKLGAPAGATNR